MALDKKHERELRFVAEKIAMHEHDLAEWQRRRQVEVVKARAAGGTIREIASVVGLSFQRVHQIIGDQGE